MSDKKDRLERLSWKRFKKGDAEWIFADEAFWLYEMIEKNYGSVVLNGYLYRIRRKESYDGNGIKLFIIRNKLALKRGENK